MASNFVEGFEYSSPEDIIDVGDLNLSEDEVGYA